MPKDPIVPEEKEIKEGEPSKEDTFVYKRDRIKTLRQIGKETQDRKKKVPEEKPEVKEVKEVKIEKPKEEPKEIKEEPKVNIDEIASKAAKEAADKVAEETKTAFKEEINKILDKDKDILDKQKEADELIASWDKEKRLPKDYQELISETMRISDVKMEQRLKAQQAEEATKRSELEEKEKVNKIELDKKQGDEKLAEYNKQIAADLDEIYSIKELPRPDKFDEVNNPETKDTAAQETQKVLKFGVELNTKLVKEGKEPVTSLSKIYFLHYKPYKAANPDKPTEVPGADAPIAGAKNTPTGESSKISYTQLHNETWAQTKMRLVREAAKRVVGK